MEGAGVVTDRWYWRFGMTTDEEYDNDERAMLMACTRPFMGITGESSQPSSSDDSSEDSMEGGRDAELR